MRSRYAWRALQCAVLALIGWFVWRSVAGQWPQVVDAFRKVTIRPVLLAASAGIVFVSYAVLIETWRAVVSAWGSSLSFGTAARIWFVSSLGKWIPGKIWAITAMGVMSRQAGVSAVAAVGSSVLVQVINILAGAAVVFLTVGNALDLPRFVPVVLAAVTVGVALTPSVLPAVARWIARTTGRDVTWPVLPHRVLVMAFIGCALAWALYGLAFQVLVRATVGVTAGASTDYIAAFTASYIFGYLVLPAPGGIGAREGALGVVLTQLGMTTAATATVIAIVSRLWLTILELVPGLILLTRMPKPSSKSDDD